MTPEYYRTYIAVVAEMKTKSITSQDNLNSHLVYRLRDADVYNITRTNLGHVAVSAAKYINFAGLPAILAPKRLEKVSGLDQC